MFNLKITNDLTENSKVLLTFTEMPFNKITTVVANKIINYISNIEGFYDTPLKDNIYAPIYANNDNGYLQIIIPIDCENMKAYYFGSDYQCTISRYMKDIEKIYEKDSIVKEAYLTSYSEKDSFTELQENVDKLRKEFEEFKSRFEPRNSIDPDMGIVQAHLNKIIDQNMTQLLTPKED